MLKQRHFRQRSRSLWGFLGDSVVKHQLPTQETQIQSLGRGDPLEKQMATSVPVFLPGKSHRERSLAGYSLWGLSELDTT